MIKNRILQILFFLSLILEISGILFSCGLGIHTRSVLGGKLYVTVNISENANQNNPVALDLVFIYDEKLLEQLLTIPAKEWFEKREQMKRDYPEGEGLDYWSWEWTPGQKIPVQTLPLKPQTEGVVVFADYLTPGAHRLRVDPFNDIMIHIAEDDFFVKSAVN